MPIAVNENLQLRFEKNKIKYCAYEGFGWVAERSNAAVLKTVEGASPPGVRIPPHPPVISISSKLYEIYTKNPRVLRGFCYFTDSDKPAIAAQSAAFIG